MRAPATLLPQPSSNNKSKHSTIESDFWAKLKPPPMSPSSMKLWPERKRLVNLKTYRLIQLLAWKHRLNYGTDKRDGSFTIVQAIAKKLSQKVRQMQRKSTTVSAKTMPRFSIMMEKFFTNSVKMNGLLTASKLLIDLTKLHNLKAIRLETMLL